MNTTPSPHKGSEEKCGKWDCSLHNEGYGLPCNDGYEISLPPSPSKECNHEIESNMCDPYCRKCKAPLPSKGIENCNCTKDPWGGDDYTCSKHETTDEKIDCWEKSAKDWQTTFDTEFLSRVYSVDDPTLGAEIVCFIAVMLSVANRQKEDWSIVEEHNKARSEVLEEIIKHIRTMERGNHEYDKAISNVLYYLSGLKSKES